MNEQRIKQFISDNIGLVLDGNKYELLGIAASRPKRQLIASKRKSCLITINYRDKFSKDILTKKLWAKEVSHPSPENYAALKKICNLFEEKGKGAMLVSPRLYSVSERCLVMDFIEGKNLLNAFILAAAKHNCAAILPLFGLCGEWLAQFHRVCFSSEYTLALAAASSLTGPLKACGLFSPGEKEKIIRRLDEIGGNCPAIPLSKSYNDYGMRNIIVNGNSVHPIDPEAMVHPVFPEKDIVFADIISFVINLKSQAKYWPVVTSKITAECEGAFLSGYQSASSFDIRANYREMYFLIALRLYLGIFERPLAKLYRGFLNKKFIRAMKNFLLWQK